MKKDCCNICFNLLYHSLPFEEIAICFNKTSTEYYKCIENPGSYVCEEFDDKQAEQFMNL